MKNLSEKLIIEFSLEQTARYLEIARRKTAGELEEDCVPTGVQIVIGIGPPFGSSASVNGHDLGEVAVNVIDIRDK